MLKYDDLKENEKRLRACTSLDRAEFEALIPHFGQAWAASIYQTQIEGQDRQRSYGGGRKATLARVSDKLLFIIVLPQSLSPARSDGLDLWSKLRASQSVGA